MENYLNIFQHPDIYKLEVISEMKKLGANKDEIALLTDKTVMNAIRNKRSPVAVAWALMQ